jgi:3-hydroxyisobutyrate dehydrogenase
MRVAILGTGIMGSGMARSLRRAGHEVHAWNRSRERAEPLAADGVTVADTPGGAVAGADALITTLHDADSVAGVLDQVDGPAGTLWLQASTVGIDGADRLGGIAARRGWVYVDSPVLGTKAPAENGTLLVLASGPDEARERATPVFDAIGSRTMWLGPAGSGSRLKMVVNSWVGAITVATAQAVMTARGLGLDPALFLSALDGAATDSPYAHIKGKAIIEDDYAPSFAVSGAVKDCRLIVAAVQRAGVDPTLANAVLALFEQAEKQGHGAEDMAAVAKALRS